ncbi:hypothetical protein B0A50_04001 [Salinomyces thailandicus]|uniref:Uncharacterized protein n=1 Tax=Salinomyces thailandicus TaxID=706561 RepID=A0A4U0U0R8_9PEZI|nr:hypothetical protein B0A50_04001 [Salinomyces thailandica]
MASASYYDQVPTSGGNTAPTTTQTNSGVYHQQTQGGQEYARQQQGGGYGQQQSGGYDQESPGGTGVQQGDHQGQKGNVQGESTGAAGQGPDAICRFLDKLERKFGGEKFNNPDNDAKNAAMNQKISTRIKKIAPMEEIANAFKILVKMRGWY